MKTIAKKTSNIIYRLYPDAPFHNEGALFLDERN